MSYRKLSFLYSVFLHTLVVGFFCLNKEVKTKRADVFFVNLVEIGKEKKFERKGFKKKTTGEVEINNKTKNEILNQFKTQEIPLKSTEEKDFKKEKNGKVESGILKENKEENDGKIEGLISIGYDEKKERGSDKSISSYKSEEESVGVIELGKTLDFSYFKLIKKKIDEKTFYPEIARRKNMEGKTKVQFIINKNGDLIDIKILKSSGNKLLDNASIEILKRASPFPEFPENLNYEKIVFTIDFNFYLKR